MKNGINIKSATFEPARQGFVIEWSNRVGVSHTHEVSVFDVLATMQQFGDIWSYSAKEGTVTLDDGETVLNLLAWVDLQMELVNKYSRPVEEALISCIYHAIRNEVENANCVWFFTNLGISHNEEMITAKVVLREAQATHYKQDVSFTVRELCTYALSISRLKDFDDEKMIVWTWETNLPYPAADWVYDYYFHPFFQEVLDEAYAVRVERAISRESEEIGPFTAFRGNAINRWARSLETLDELETMATDLLALVNLLKGEPMNKEREAQRIALKMQIATLRARKAVQTRSRYGREKIEAIESDLLTRLMILEGGNIEDIF